MFSVDCVGRMLEVRLSDVLTVAETAAFRSKLAEQLVRSTGRFVICVDLRTCVPFDDNVKLMLLGLMRSDNPRVERAAYLSQSSGPNQAIVEEILGALRSPVRRQFSDPRELQDWLGEALEPTGRERLATFLGEAT